MRPGELDSAPGVDPLNKQSSREWHRLADNSPNFTQYPGATYVADKNSMAEAAPTILRFPEPAYRVNADGLVVMRGLLRKNTGANIAAADVVLAFPRHIRPKLPQELRFWGESCVLIYKPDTNTLEVNNIYFAAIYVNLGGVVFYKD